MRTKVPCVIYNAKDVENGECDSRESPAAACRTSLDLVLLLFSIVSSNTATLSILKAGKCGVKERIKQ